MAQISKVALAGKGRLGSVVLDELLKAGFKVTVLTRSASSIKDVPDGVDVHEVDYSSEEPLRKVLQGHDAVVSTVAGVAIASQKPLIDAAISAGVKHFIPAEYATSLRNSLLRALPIYTDACNISNYLQVRSDKIDWTVVAPGSFLEYSFDLPYVVDLPNRKMDMIDGGEVPGPFSEFITVAKAVVGVFRQPERVKDHCVQVYATLLTQKDVFEIVQKHDQNPEPWTVEEVDGEVKLQQGINALKRGDLSMKTTSTIGAGTMWSSKYNVAFKEIDNEWLGVDFISRERIEEIIKDKVRNGVSGIVSEQIISTFE